MRNGFNPLESDLIFNVLTWADNYGRTKECEPDWRNEHEHELALQLLAEMLHAHPYYIGKEYAARI